MDSYVSTDHVIREMSYAIYYVIITDIYSIKIII